MHARARARTHTHTHTHTHTRNWIGTMLDHLDEDGAGGLNFAEFQQQIKKLPTTGAGPIHLLKVCMCVRIYVYTHGCVCAYICVHTWLHRYQKAADDGLSGGRSLSSAPSTSSSRAAEGDACVTHAYACMCVCVCVCVCLWPHHGRRKGTPVLLTRLHAYANTCVPRTRWTYHIHLFTHTHT